MSAQRVAAVIPCRNAARYLTEALESVFRQTRLPEQVLVVDDGSEDDTTQVLAAFMPRVRVLSCPGRGSAAARNLGIQSADADLIAFLDADDAWEPARLERQLAELDRRPEAHLIFSDALLMDTEGGLQDGTYLHGRKPATVGRSSLLADNYICTSSVLARRDTLLGLGGFQDGLRVAHDYDLWLRLLSRHPAVFVDRPLVRYRVRPESLSNDRAVNLQETLSALQTERRRAGLRGWLALGSRLFALEYTLAHLMLLRGEVSRARAGFLRAVMARPWSPGAWVFLLATLAGRPIAVPMKAAIAVGKLLGRGQEPDILREGLTEKNSCPPDATSGTGGR